MRPLLGVELCAEDERLLLFLDILLLNPLALEVAAPDCGEREVEIRPRDVEVDALGGVVFL